MTMLPQILTKQPSTGLARARKEVPTRRTTGRRGFTQRVGRVTFGGEVAAVLATMRFVKRGVVK